ncbi:urea transporter [Wenyingzhuangia sp. IMCC45574]
MTLKQKIKANYFLQSTLNSYSLMFFSQDNVFALCILAVTLFNPFVGICGLAAILIVNGMANALGFDKDEVRMGLFGFNALFVGMSMGYEFNLNFPFVILFLSALIILLLITASLKGLLGMYNLPFLVFPFIITYWIVSLAAHNFENISFDETHVYLANKAVKAEASWFYSYLHALDGLPLSSFVLTFLRTLAGTFFQTSVLAGLIIAIGLLQFSRIAFSLSVLGFACAYFYYYIFGADVSDLNHNLLGANFIFVGIAIGCFFIIPNIYSYIAVIVLTPIVLLTSLALTKILLQFNIKPYSISFSLITIGFLFALNQRLFSNYLQVVTLQYFSAEKTIYKFLNSIQRFKNEHLYKLALPFTGEWNVSQGYDGGITHLGDWGKALDFVIEDEKSNTYRLPLSAREGFGVGHFYCYDKDVVAPYDGYVYDIINTVEDNDVGDMDTNNNWGNTIIINHLNGLFSQISHVKKDSFKVYIGQYVTKGTFLGTCGNSGRSPEPHIHFQLQTTPVIGEKTYPYPIGYFIERQGDKKLLRVSEVPKEGTFISNVTVTHLLSVAFGMLPGDRLEITKEGTNETLHWEVKTDAFNRKHIYCKTSKSYVYFENDGVMFYCTDFEGSKKSVLFQFYLATYRQLLGYYPDVVLDDKVPLIHFNARWVQFIQDFLAPFYLFTRANYQTKFVSVDNTYAPQNMVLHSEVEASALGYSFRKVSYQMELKDYEIKRFTVQHKHKQETYLFKKN